MDGIVSIELHKLQSVKIGYNGFRFCEEVAFESRRFESLIMQICQDCSPLNWMDTPSMVKRVTEKRLERSHTTGKIR